MNLLYNNKLKRGSMPQISIIVPVYNAEKYLSQCLDSILNQTFKDFECICIDDGSTDTSLTILQKYANIDSRIKIINQENKGVSSARNIGIKNSLGQYLLFVDSDDWLTEDCLDKTFNKIKNTSADVVQFNYKFYYSKEEKYESKTILESEKIKKEDTISSVLQKSYEGPVWRRIYKKDVLLKNNLLFYEGRSSSEDGVFSAILFLYTKNIVYVQDELYIYRKQISSSLTNNLNKLFVDWFYNFYIMIKDVKNRGFLSEEAIKWCIHVFCWDYSRIGKEQSKNIQIDMLKHSINLIEYLLKNTKSFGNIIKLNFVFYILKIFNLYSYKIIRIFKNLV